MREKMENKPKYSRQIGDFLFKFNDPNEKVTSGLEMFKLGNRIWEANDQSGANKKYADTLLQKARRLIIEGDSTAKIFLHYIDKNGNPIAMPVEDYPKKPKPAVLKGTEFPFIGTTPREIKIEWKDGKKIG